MTKLGSALLPSCMILIPVKKRFAALEIRSKQHFLVSYLILQHIIKQAAVGMWPPEVQETPAHNSGVPRCPPSPANIPVHYISVILSVGFF